MVVRQWKWQARRALAKAVRRLKGAVNSSFAANVLQRGKEAVIFQSREDEVRTEAYRPISTVQCGWRRRRAPTLRRSSLRYFLYLHYSPLPMR